MPISASHSDTRITVLISGSGTNLQALIDAILASPPVLRDAQIVRVISNRKGAKGLVRAQNAGIPTTYHNLTGYTKAALEKLGESPAGPDEARARQDARDRYDIDLAELVLKDEPQLVVCAGWMHILSPPFLTRLREKAVDIINLHPALYNAFNGAQAIERAHAAFMAGRIAQTGVMIHDVIPEVDMGAPLIEVPIPLEHPRDDNIEALEERIHEVEHVAIVNGTRMAVERIRSRS